MKQLETWLEQIEERASAGGVWKRARVLPRPLTPYACFEIEWAYLYCASAGEQIRILTVDEFAQLALLKDAGNDFWLIDNEVVFAMKYLPSGEFDGYRILTTELDVGPFRATRDLLMGAGIPFADYLSRNRRAAKGSC